MPMATATTTEQLLPEAAETKSTGQVEEGEAEESRIIPEDPYSRSPPNESKERSENEESGETQENLAIAPSAPPLPTEPPPGAMEDDGWEPVWDSNAQAYYFYNRLTGATQWDNPRVPQAPAAPPGVGKYDRDPGGPPAMKFAPPTRGGYNPAIHGDYDPDADYAQDPEEESISTAPGVQGNDPTAEYTATGAFNRFTGRWQAADVGPDLHNDESKSKRQMNAYFDVDAAANSHNGKSLKAERSGKKLSKQELRAFKEKRKEKKEEKRRAWLRD